MYCSNAHERPADRRSNRTRRSLMTTTNINRVVLTGNLTQDPELRLHARTAPPSAACASRPTPGARTPPAANGPTSPTTSTSPSSAPRARTPPATSAKGRGVAIDGRLDWREWQTPGRLQAPSHPDHRRHRPVPRRPTTRTQRPASQPGDRRHRQLRRRHSVLIPRARLASAPRNTAPLAGAGTPKKLAAASAAATRKRKHRPGRR